MRRCQLRPLHPDFPPGAPLHSRWHAHRRRPTDGAPSSRHIATFTDAELDDLEQVLELLDVDLQDWLSGRRPIPAEVASPMLDRMAAECAGKGAGTTPEIRAGLGLDKA